jgi:uncharacterized damage-inducible protein DinB
MAPTAHELADRFERANRDVLAALAPVSDAGWRALCPDEGWPVGVTAHHIATTYPAHLQRFLAIATGDALPAITREEIDRRNAAHSVHAAGCSKAETLALLAAHGRRTAAALRELDTQQLERAAPVLEGLPPMTVAGWIERVLIGHPLWHLAGIGRALGAPSA